MISSRLIGVVLTVTFALTTVLCGCAPSFAAGEKHASSAHAGCHGGHGPETGDNQGAPSGDHEKNCQHCNHARLLETRDSGKALSAPILNPVSLPPVAAVFTPALASVELVAWNHRSRAAPPPIHLLHCIFLI